MRVAWLLAACAHAAATPPAPDPLADGDHTVDVGGVSLAYHVHGRGPTCIVHSGGPGLQWSYLRMPAVEASMRLVYLEPVGTGASGALHVPAADT